MRQIRTSEDQGDLFADSDDPDLQEWSKITEASRRVFKCDVCNYPISADEARTSGIGHQCAAKLGRMVHVANKVSKAKKDLNCGDMPVNRASDLG